MKIKVDKQVGTIYITLGKELSSSEHVIADVDNSETRVIADYDQKSKRLHGIEILGISDIDIKELQEFTYEDGDVCLRFSL